MFYSQVLRLSQMTGLLVCSRGQIVVFVCLFFVCVFGGKNDGKKSVSEAAASSALSYLAPGSE